MKILLKNITDILEDKLSMEERGLLITIVLVKDNIPMFTLSKLKTAVKFNDDIKNILCSLHKKKFIQWSGFEKYKKYLDEKKSNPDIENIFNFMNDLFKTNYNHKAEYNTKNLEARLKENSVEDIKLVIANRYKEWKDDAMMKKYLTPTTIFRPSKFSKYLQEAKKTDKGRSLLAVKNIGLKNGEEITLEKSKTFIDSELYNIRIWRLSENGERLGIGMKSTRTGRAIKRSLRIQSNRLQEVNKEFEYTYIEE